MLLSLLHYTLQVGEPAYYEVSFDAGKMMDGGRMVIMEIYWEFTAGETKHLDVTDVDRFMHDRDQYRLEKFKKKRVLSFRSVLTH